MDPKSTRALLIKENEKNLLEDEFLLLSSMFVNSGKRRCWRLNAQGTRHIRHTHKWLTIRLRAEKCREEGAGAFTSEVEPRGEKSMSVLFLRPLSSTSSLAASTIVHPDIISFLLYRYTYRYLVARAMRSSATAAPISENGTEWDDPTMLKQEVIL